MDELASSRFISGIYNYCDQWCERCRFNDRCYLYDQGGSEQSATLLQGRDPSDPKVVQDDMADAFQRTLGMLQQMAEQAGVDLEAPDEGKRLDLNGPMDRVEQHPLHRRLERWGERIGVLLHFVRAEMPDEGREVLERLKDGRIADPVEAVAALGGLRDACELLVRYRFFLVVKLARALDGWEEARREREPLLRDAGQNDALGTAKVVHDCLGKAARALWQIGEFSQPWMEMAMPIALETESLRQAIDTQFPGHQAFHRPGFDDDPGPDASGGYGTP